MYSLDKIIDKADWWFPGHGSRNLVENTGKDGICAACEVEAVKRTISVLKSQALLLRMYLAS